jgi:hypothetical protein
MKFSFDLFRLSVVYRLVLPDYLFLALLVSAARRSRSAAALLAFDRALWRGCSRLCRGSRRAAASLSGRHDNWIFESLDGGANWIRLSKVGGRCDDSDDLIVDSIVVDASDQSTIFAGVWRVDRPDGGLYVSHDAGKTWKASRRCMGNRCARWRRRPPIRRSSWWDAEGCLSQPGSRRDLGTISPRRTIR